MFLFLIPPAEATIVSVPVDVNVTQGQQVLLPCTSEGIPVPTVVWYKREENSDTYTLLEHTGRHNLLLAVY